MTISDTWEAIAEGGRGTLRFDPETTRDLPEPAQRFLRAAISPGSRLDRTVELTMHGRIKLGRWMPFTARQILHAGRGFVWEARAGRRPLVFTGSDSLLDGAGSMDFRLWSRIPVARASGPDVDRSAAGRLAAETVVWLPQAVTPQAGASWTAVDDDHAAVDIAVDNTLHRVHLTIDREGALTELWLDRWGDPDGFHELVPFGGVMASRRTEGGVTVVDEGRVGWRWNSPTWEREGEFFRFTVDEIRWGVH